MDLGFIKNISLIIGAIIGISTLVFHIRSSRNVARQQIWSDLFQDFKGINDYISTNHGDLIKPPYPELKSGQVTGMLILHHINLAFRFWANRKLMSKDEIEGFERWMRIIFFEWIKSDHKLSSDLITIVDFKDIYPEEFLKWIVNHSEYQAVLRKNKSGNA